MNERHRAASYMLDTTIDSALDDDPDEFSLYFSYLVPPTLTHSHPSDSSDFNSS